MQSFLGLDSVLLVILVLPLSTSPAQGFHCHTTSKYLEELWTNIRHLTTMSTQSRGRHSTISELCVTFALPSRKHSENCPLCPRRSAAWLRQLCFGRRNDEKRCSSAARTECRRPGSRLGHQPSVDQLIYSAQTLPLASNSPAHPIQDCLHYIQNHLHYSACIFELCSWTLYSSSYIAFIWH